VSVEAVDPVFQAKMLDMLKQTGRPEMVVGWYHSHPGFGCWLSGVDINTQQSFEALSDRAVAVVVDPIQSVKGKVRIFPTLFIQHPRILRLSHRGFSFRLTTPVPL
jgi:26S proteasome regulatory subunit N11